MKTSRLKNFIYKYDKGAGPLSIEELEKENFTEGNCRLALQYYFYKESGLYLEPERILLPEAYKNVGKFVFKEEPIDFSKLKRGYIIYAQNLRNSKGELLNKDKEKFKNEDEWILYFHTAIFLGNIDGELLDLLPEGDYPKNVPLIWQSTIIEKGTCVWTFDKFLNYYKPISVKRLD